MMILTAVIEYTVIHSYVLYVNLHKHSLLYIYFSCYCKNICLNMAQKVFNFFMDKLNNPLLVVCVDKNIRTLSI